MLDEREIYWIEYYNSYKNGYNRTPGGKAVREEEHPRSLLTTEQVWQIREDYANEVRRKDAYDKVKNSGISLRGFKKIWDGETWKTIHMDVYTSQNKEWHNTYDKNHSKHIERRVITKEEIDLWKLDYKNGMSIYKISQKYHRDHGTMSMRLNDETVVNRTKTPGVKRKVKNLNTNHIFNSISAAAKWASCGATTLTRHLATDCIAGKVPETNEEAKWEEIL